MFKHIVTAVDGSHAGDRVIEMSCDLAKLANCELTIVHVPQTETAALAVGAVAGMHAAMTMPSSEEIEAAGQNVVDEALAVATKCGMPSAAGEMRRGAAADTVVALADELGADLIVSGRRGLGGLTSLVMGSTSQRIGHLAKCSCLTVV